MSDHDPAGVKSPHDADAPTTTETFERTFSFWDAGIVPERLVYTDRAAVHVTDAKIVGDEWNEEVVIEFEVER